MLFRNLAIIAALCVTAVNGFASTRSPAVSRSSTALNIMSAADLDAIINEAEACAHGECAVDEVDSLVNNLLEQQKMLNQRISEIDELVKDLEHLNGRDNRPTDEVRDTVKAIFRIFALGNKASGNDYPSLSRATGYSGDVAGGGKTAYDVLPPRKIKK